MSKVTDDIATLEATLLQAGPGDAPNVAAMLAPSMMPEPPEDQAEEVAQGEEVLPDDYMTPEEFYEQTFLPLHMGGSVLAQTKTRRDVDLVSPAMSGHGRAASDAFHRMCSRYAFARRMVLTKGASAFTDLMVIASYGQSLVATIRNAPPLAEAQA